MVVIGPRVFVVHVAAKVADDVKVVELEPLEVVDATVVMMYVAVVVVDEVAVVEPDTEGVAVERELYPARYSVQWCGVYHVI